MINTNIKKQYQQTPGSIQRLTNISHLLLIGVIVAEKFCLTKCVFVVYKFVLHRKQITCQTDKENRLKHAQFLQGVPVWRMIKMMLLAAKIVGCQQTYNHTDHITTLII